MSSFFQVSQQKPCMHSATFLIKMYHAYIANMQFLLQIIQVIETLNFSAMVLLQFSNPHMQRKY
jgi:hypothetical protein